MLSCQQVGHAIPFEQLGFLHLVAFLRSLPDVCSLVRERGVEGWLNVRVLGVAIRATAHVQVCPLSCPPSYLESCCQRAISQQPGARRLTDSLEDVEVEVDFDQEYKFYNGVHTPILLDIKGWVQNALAGALGQEVGTREPSYSQVLELAQHLQGLLGAWKSRAVSTAASWGQDERTTFTQTAPLDTMSALVRAELRHCEERHIQDFYMLHPETRLVFHRLSVGSVMDGLGSEAVFVSLVEDVNSVVTLAKAAVMHLLRSSLVLEEEVWGHRVELPHPALQLVLQHASREGGLNKLGACCQEVGSRVTEGFYLHWISKRIVDLLVVFKSLMFGGKNRLVMMDEGEPDERYQVRGVDVLGEDYKVYLPRMALHLGHLVRLQHSRHLAGLGVQLEGEQGGHWTPRHTLSGAAPGRPGGAAGGR